VKCGRSVASEQQSSFESTRWLRLRFLTELLCREKATTNAALIAVLLLGLILRVGATFEFPNINHPDEIYQTIEQARRLTIGDGIVPWEFEKGIRSWVLPGFFAGLMELSRQAGRAPDNYLAVIHSVMDLVSIIPIACGFLWGLRVFDLGGAILVGFVIAIWPDLIYFAPHTLTEVAAGNILPAGFYLAYPDRGEVGAKRLFAAGLWFGLTVVVRFHLAPIIAVAVGCVCGLQVRRRWIPLLVGASIPVLAGGLLDALTLGYPFQSVWLNIWLNLYKGISNQFGVFPWFYILGFLLYFWGGAFALVIALALLGARRLPLLLAAAAAILMMHSLIGHKEYRFIYPALPLIATLVGIGTVEVLHALWKWLQPGCSQKYGVLMAMGIWACISVCLLASAPFQYLLLHFSGAIAAFRNLSSDHDVCGIALYKVEGWKVPGHSYLRKGIDLYELNSESQLRTDEKKFNAIITESPTAVPDRAFSRLLCFDNGYNIRTNQLGITANQRAEPICVWRRPGNCVR
jgi:GPI mannosyltransferase 3